MFCPECGEVTAPGPLDPRHQSSDRSHSLWTRLRRITHQLVGKAAPPFNRPGHQ
jgi:hypothetical protein